MATKTFIFEHTDCSRCGGSGHYSYNTMTGSRCFKCNGAGVTLTKRGAKAQELYRLLLSKRYIDLEPGDKIQDLGIPGFTAGGWRTVVSTTLTTASYSQNGEQISRPAIDVECEGFGLQGYGREDMIRVAATREEKALAKEQALAFQARLTKQGKIAKRPVR